MEVRGATSQAEWENLSSKAGALLQQSWAYGAAVEALNGRILRLVVSDGKPIALAQLVVRKFAGIFDVALLTCGPVWLGDPTGKMRMNVVTMLKRHISLRGGLLISSPPGVEQPICGFTQIMSATTHGLLRLSGEPDTMRAAMHGKWRNRLSFAEQAGLEIKRAKITHDRLDWLMKAEDAQRKARKYQGLPLPFLSRLTLNATGSARLYTAENTGNPIAAMLFLRHEGAATYLVGWSGERGRQKSAHNLLLWCAMRDFGADGVHSLDLGTLNTRDAPGLARFKLGAGALALRNSGTWIAPLSPATR